MLRDRWVILTYMVCVFAFAALLVLRGETDNAQGFLGGAAFVGFLIMILLD